jgi:hypothetical protein
MRLIVVGGLVASLFFATLAHADATTTAVPIGDPYTDTIQLWSEITSALSSLANGIATIVNGQEFTATDPKATSNQQEPASLAAAATMTAFESATNTPATSTGPTPITTSYRTTDSPNVQSADLSILTPPANSDTSSLSAPPASNFVTQDQLNTQLSLLYSSLSTRFSPAATPSLPENISADGNAEVPYAAENAIDNLSNVTITNANLTASEIPDLSDTYLSHSGGNLIGALTSSSTATTTFAAGFNILSGCFSVNGTCISGGSGSDATLSAANTWSALQSFFGGASTTNLSNFGAAYFGGTATSSFNSAGVLTLAAPLAVTSGGTGWASLATGYIPFGNGSAALATSSNLFWDNTNGRLGIGTSTPGSIFSVQGVANWTSATSTYYSTGGVNLSGGCFAIKGNCIGGGGGSSASSTLLTDNNTWTGSNLFFASTTVGNGTQAGGLTINGGATTTGNVLIQGALTSAASSSLTVGNPATPAFQVLASSTNAATGLQLISNLAGNGIILQGITSGTSDILTINAAGAGGNQGNLNLNTIGNVFLAGNTLSIYNQASEFNYSRGPSNTAATFHFLVQDAGDSALTAGTEAPEVYFNLGHATRTHANGAIATQRDFHISGTTHAFSSYATSNNIGNLIAVSIDPSQEGVNGTTTNNIGLQVTSQALNASTTNAYGLQVSASTGAVNNVAGQFFGELAIGTEPGTTLPSNSLFLISSSTSGATTTLFNVLNNGNATLAGTLTQNSDQRLKTNIQSLDASSSLSAIDALRPVTFNWANGIFGDGLQTGFIAQEVQPIFPNLVSTTSPTALTPDGTLGLNYTGLISPIVAAIQALDQQLTNVESTIAGFANSFTTGDLTFTRDLCAQESNGAQICITGDQLAALVEQAGQGSSSAPSPDNTEASNTPPQIEINGANPAIVQVGDTYNDLGATITGPQADLNLGITTYLNGILTSPVQIDTSAAATDTIDYVATDQNGLTSTSTRTVIIEGPSIAPTDDASSSPEETATTTDATTTAQ